MTTREPRLLDAFCGAGGTTRGYQQAGFHVTGVDIAPQPNYIGDDFVLGDAVDFIHHHGWEFDAIHASPPCQSWTTAAATARRHHNADYPELIEPTRRALEQTNRPWVIENVPGAPLRYPIQLCGSSFGLDLERHRLFETPLPILPPPCDHWWQTRRFRSLDSRMAEAGKLARVVGVHGHCQYAGEFEVRCAAMGIDWMTNDELCEAIPPAYTQFVGEHLRDAALKEVHQ